MAAMSDNIPVSRCYVHSKCGNTTEVDGGDFKNVASPVPGMVKTVCSACGMPYPVSEFQWEDSGESLPAYYERYRARVPALTRRLCSRQASVVMLLVGFLIGVALGVWSWNALGAIWGTLIGVISSLVGAIASLVVWDSMQGRLLSRSLGVVDVRCLK